jgi:hypothetical protein
MLHGGGLEPCAIEVAGSTGKMFLLMDDAPKMLSERTRVIVASALRKLT